MDNEQLLAMLDSFNPAWDSMFASLREAAEYYGLEAMLEYDMTPDDELYQELDFND